MSCNGVDMTESNITTLTRELPSARNNAAVCYHQFCELLSHALNGTASLEKWIRETAHSTSSSDAQSSQDHTVPTTASARQLNNDQGCLPPVNSVVTHSDYRLRANQSCPSDFFVDQKLQTDSNDVRLLPDQRVGLLRGDASSSCGRSSDNSLRQDGLHNLICALQQCSSLTGESDAANSTAGHTIQLLLHILSMMSACIL